MGDVGSNVSVKLRVLQTSMFLVKYSTVQCAIKCSIQCTIYRTVQYTVYRTVYIVHYSVQCTV